nr:MAG TPA: hypothetical protein [Caudoviricetes sp.]
MIVYSGTNKVLILRQFKNINRNTENIQISYCIFYYTIVEYK